MYYHIFTLSALLITEFPYNKQHRKTLNKKRPPDKYKRVNMFLAARYLLFLPGFRVENLKDDSKKRLQNT